MGSLTASRVTLYARADGLMSCMLVVEARQPKIMGASPVVLLLSPTESSNEPAVATNENPAPDVLKAWVKRYYPDLINYATAMRDMEQGATSRQILGVEFELGKTLDQDVENGMVDLFVHFMRAMNVVEKHTTWISSDDTRVIAETYSENVERFKDASRRFSQKMDAEEITNADQVRAWKIASKRYKRV